MKIFEVTEIGVKNTVTVIKGKSESGHFVLKATAEFPLKFSEAAVQRDEMPCPAQAMGMETFFPDAPCGNECDDCHTPYTPWEADGFTYRRRHPLDGTVLNRYFVTEGDFLHPVDWDFAGEIHLTKGSASNSALVIVRYDGLYNQHWNQYTVFPGRGVLPIYPNYRKFCRGTSHLVVVMEPGQQLTVVGTNYDDGGVSKRYVRPIELEKILATVNWDGESLTMTPVEEDALEEAQA